jgi:putative DNA primase/helicase
MAVAPLHAFHATTAGSGKSYLADVASAIVSGRPCSVISISPRPEETESRLVGCLLAGFPLISLDNVNQELGGDLLSQAIERPTVRVRRLGASDIFEIDSRATIFATGNGIRLRGDMTRRALLASLDAGVERPELREFSHRPVEQILADRGRYIAAALNIVRAFLCDNNAVSPSPFPSFEEWSNTVRAALVWLGQVDPCASMEAIREGDSDLEGLRDVLVSWRDCLGQYGPLSVRELVDRAAEQQDAQSLRDALQTVAGVRGSVDRQRLTYWIRSRQGRIVDGLSIRRAGEGRHRAPLWAVVNRAEQQQETLI